MAPTLTPSSDTSAATTADPGKTSMATPDSSDLADLEELGLTPMGSMDGAVPITPKEEPVDNSAGGAAIRGLKQALAPVFLTKEELEGKHSGASTAIETGTSIITDILTGAGTAALAGSAFGPVGTVLAPIVWALYRGVGYEMAKSNAAGESFNPLRAMLNAAAEVNPLTSKGGKLAKFGTQAVLEGAKSYAYDEDVVSAAISGAVGGAFAGLFHKNGPGWFAVAGNAATTPNSKLGKDDLESLQRLVADTSPTGLSARTNKLGEAALKENPNFFIRTDADENDLFGFKRWVAENSHGYKGRDRDEIEAIYAHELRRQRNEVLDKDFVAYKNEKLLLKAAEDYLDDVAQDVGGVKHAKDPTKGGMVDKLRDALFMARKVDNVTGRSLEGVINNLVEAKSKQSVIMSALLDDANQLVKRGQKLGMSNESIGKVLAAAEEGKAYKLSPERQALVDDWAKLWERTRVKLNEEGLWVPKAEVGGEELDKYLPKRSRTGADLHTAVRRWDRDLTNKYGPDYLQKYKGEHIPDDIFEFKKTISHFSDLDPNDVRYRRDVQKVLDEALDPRNSKTLEGFDPGATYARNHAALIPSNVRDYDVGNLFVNYVNNNFKSIYYRQPMQELKTEIAVMRKLGFENSADYWTRYLKDISGHPSEALAKTQASINSYKATIDKLMDDGPGHGLKHGALKTARVVPELMSWMVGSLYPNYLGGNLKAAIRNYAQPMLTTAPELGWDYGTKLVGKGTVMAANAKRQGINMEEFLQSKGLAPGKFHGEAQDLTSTSIRGASRKLGAVLETMDKVNSGGLLKGKLGTNAEGEARELPGLMSLYSKSDVFNRFVTYKVAEEVAKDAAAGNKRAQDFMTRVLSAGGKSRIRDAKDFQQATDELAKNLIAKTQFNYGKESMNEFGRTYGRLFSMFTKWPAMIMSDGAELMDRDGIAKGLGKIGQRYFAPMIALTVAGQMLHTKDDPLAAYLLGSELGDAAPAQSMKVGLGPVPTSALDAMKLGMEMLTKDMDAEQRLKKVGKFINKQAHTYIPGMSLANEYKRWQKANGETDD